jgi:hypothetical protein
MEHLYDNIVVNLSTDNMGHFISSITIDLLEYILQYINLCDLISFKRVSISLYKQIEFNEDILIYSIFRKKNISFPNDWFDSLYTSYFRGKDYDWTTKGVDILFNLPDTEYIISCYYLHQVCFVITINVNLNYQIYIFNPVVGIDEHTPDFEIIGIDGMDIYKYSLTVQSSYINLDTLFSNYLNLVKDNTEICDENDIELVIQLINCL